MTTENPKLATIRSLLVKAEDKAATPEEAEAFRAKAYDLIAKYGIDEAELAMSNPDLNVVGDRKIVMHAPFAQEKVSLFMAVAGPMGVRAVQRKEWASGKPWREGRSDRQVVVLHVFGTVGDLDRADLLYTSLLLQQANEAAKESAPGYLNMQEKAAWRRSWLVGYAERISVRLARAEREAQAAKPTMTNASTGETKSTALVLASKSELVDTAVSNEYPHLRRATARSLTGGGYYSGAAAGDRANISTGKGVGSSAKGQLR